MSDFKRVIKETKGREELYKYILSLIFYSNITKVKSIDCQVHTISTYFRVRWAKQMLLLVVVVYCIIRKL